MPYTIEEHRHRFAAWAASRAASVKTCRFKVEQGKQIIEESGLARIAQSITNLPEPVEFDAAHLKWRNSIIASAQQHLGADNQPLAFTHGIAAKLINIYLKSIFISVAEQDDRRILAIHPPIDALLLDALWRGKIGGQEAAWNQARKIRWSKFNSNDYQCVINAVKASIPQGGGLWKIEEYWQGFQANGLATPPVATPPVESTCRTLSHGGNAVEFRYRGSVASGLEIIYANSATIRVNSQLLEKLIENFKAKTVEGGFTSDNPSRGGIGEWVNDNSNLTPQHASRIAAILVREGYATLEEGRPIRLTFK